MICLKCFNGFETFGEIEKKKLRHRNASSQYSFINMRVLKFMYLVSIFREYIYLLEISVKHNSYCRRHSLNHRTTCFGLNRPSTDINYVLCNICVQYTLTLREERRLRVFENRVLRRVFGPKSDEVTGEWRKLHNEELSNMYSLPNIVRVVKSRRMRWVGHVASMGEGRGVHRVLVGKPEGKRPLGRPRRRWEDNNKMDLQEV